MTVKLRYDGRVFVPETPVDLPIGHTLELDLPAASLDDRFHQLAGTWQRAVAHQSSSSVRYGHPAYRAIIAFGPPVVPLLLRDLADHRRHWFAALKAITGADPVPPQDAGDFDRMADAWLRWGAEQGLR
ncbi:MAG: hypothetical protein U0746_17565 [Gemmataceae bacterium]